MDNKAKQYHKSAGDILFDVGVYGGLGYVANAAISLAVERYAVHLPQTTLHKIGQASEKTFAHLLRGVTKPESLDYWAKKSNQILFLGSGGWLLLIPMKWLEDHKSQIIRSIDDRLHTGPQTPEGITQQLTALAEAPQQSYGSLVVGRIVSYASTIAFALPFVTKWTRTSDRLALFLEKQIGSQLGSLQHPAVLVGETQVPAFLNSLGVETILAGTASALHYGASKFAAATGQELSKKNEQPQTRIHEIDYDKRAAPAQAQLNALPHP